jgi:hypothetical protein
MMRKLFRPGAGQKPARYVAALTTATNIYRGDCVVWDYSATPTAITWGGVTLGAKDMVFVDLNETTITNSAGKQAGLVEGTHIGNSDTTTAITDATTGALLVVQTWGVFDDHANTVDNTVIAGSVLVLSTVAGEMDDVIVANVATDITYPFMVGVSLSADATYTRGTATTNTGVTAFVRCDW